MTHLTLTSFVVFFAMAAFGVVIFALASLASHGAFSPTVQGDESPQEPGAGDEADEIARRVHYPARGQDVPSSFDS